MFYDYDGSLLYSIDAHYGDVIEVPENPTRPADENYSYQFIGWDKEVTNCTGNDTYYAQYSQNVIEYTVIFNNYDGSEIEKIFCSYGDEIKAPTGVTRPADETYTYTFKGWDKEVVNCNGNAVYTAQFDQTFIEYLVEFKNYDGSVLSSQIYHFGDQVQQPANPVREADEMNVYTFIGWDKEVVNCYGDTVYTAQYDVKPIKYTVIFEDWNGEVIETAYYNYNDEIEFIENPIRESDEVYNYIFVEWKNAVTHCVGNVTFTAVYQEVFIEYQVVFKNEDDSIISSATYHYGDEIVVADAPVKEANNIYRYIFNGWQNLSNICVGNAEYKASFTEQFIEYIITFCDYDGSVIETATYHYGDMVSEPKQPTRLPQDDYEYIFKGWDKPIVIVSEDATYTAEYDSIYVGPDLEKIQEFLDAFNGIDNSSMSKKYNSLVNAIKIYNALEEREKQALAQEYQLLVAKVEKYNSSVDEITSEHADALKVVAELLGILSGLAGLAYVGKRI